VIKNKFKRKEWRNSSNSMSYFQNHVSSAWHSLETSSSTSAISNEVRGGWRRSASVFDGPSIGRRSKSWVEGGHENADTQFWEYSWNQEIFNIPSGQEIYRGLKPALARERPGRDAIRTLEEGRNRDSKSGPKNKRGKEGGRDVAESYGPSMSRSNILANLCPIKINQTPSRSAVSVHHQCRATINLRHLLAAI